MKRIYLSLFGVVACLHAAVPGMAAESSSLDSQRFLAAVQKFADCVLERGRDVYGPRKTPLFVDGLNVETFDPARWQRGGQTWVLCNFASQQALMRTLDGLTALTKQPRYREAAEMATREVLTNLRSPSGALNWGGHMAWDLEGERAVGEYADVHELKNHQAYYPLLWRVDARLTRQVLEGAWAIHVLDWSLLDYNRHASMAKPRRPQWGHAFIENTDVPYASTANNLSFVNVTPPLLDAGVALAVLGNDTNALTWTRRLIYRWQQARDPKTGLCGGQLSYRKEDRAQEALGHVHPNINEAKFVATYHRVNRYHDLPVAQLQAAEQLLAAGGKQAEVGREFIRWAADDLKTYFNRCYDAKSGEFISMLTDGTPIKGDQARAGYYDTSSFSPGRPDGDLLWGTVMAFRLTRDPQLWTIARTYSERLKLGEIGVKARGKRVLQLDSPLADRRVLYAVLEMTRITKDREFLKLAARIGDNLLKQQKPNGLFPRAGRVFARTGDEIPLALLHLAAALDRRDALLPPAMLDHAYFHCEYDGKDIPQKPGIEDHRTYDSTVFYGE